LVAAGGELAGGDDDEVVVRVGADHGDPPRPAGRAAVAHPAKGHAEGVADISAQSTQVTRRAFAVGVRRESRKGISMLAGKISSRKMWNVDIPLPPRCEHSGAG